jgi:hypothetical protein
VSLTPTLSALARFCTLNYDFVRLGPLRERLVPLPVALATARLFRIAIGTVGTNPHGASLHSLSSTRDRLARTPTVHFPFGSEIAGP